MKVFQNLKIWIITALITVVLGATFCAIFGLNQTPDYKAAYEVSVSVDQNVKGSGELVKNTAENYFSEKGYKFSTYATQKTNDGSTFIYKFHGAGDISESELESRLAAALDADENLNGLGLKASAAYGKTATTSDISAGALILAVLLALLAAFVISLFIVKLASATVIVCNAVMTAILYIFLIAITRIPASTDLIIGCAVGVILSVFMTFVVSCRYKEKLKADEKADIKDVAEYGLKCGFLRISVLACAGVIAAIALSATGSAYLLFTGLKILVATVSAFIVSVVATPTLWTALKNVKAKK